MTGFSVDKDGKQTGGLEQWATSLGKMVGSVKGLWQQLETGKKKFDAMNAAAGKSKSSFSDYDAISVLVKDRSFPKLVMLENQVLQRSTIVGALTCDVL